MTRTSPSAAPRPWTQTVNAAASSTVITETLGANPSTFGDALTFTATVSGPGRHPTGTVQFSIDGVASGLPVTLLAGVATLSTSSLTAGPHTIDAAYSGDANFAVSSATTFAQTVDAAASSTVITETTGTNPSTFGDSLLFTATVSGPGGTPTGTVQFSIDGVASGRHPVTLLAVCRPRSARAP